MVRLDAISLDRAPLRFGKLVPRRLEMRQAVQRHFRVPHGGGQGRGGFNQPDVVAIPLRRLQRLARCRRRRMIQQINERGAHPKQIGGRLLLVRRRSLALQPTAALRRQRHEPIAGVQIVAVVGGDLLINGRRLGGLAGLLQQPRLGVEPLPVAEGLRRKVQRLRGQVAQRRRQRPGLPQLADLLQRQVHHLPGTRILG